MEKRLWRCGVPQPSASTRLDACLHAASPELRFCTSSGRAAPLRAGGTTFVERSRSGARPYQLQRAARTETG